MARYLVTGGAGFIGSHLVDSLMADGHAVRVLDDLSSGSADNLPARAELQVSDVIEPDAVRRAMEGVDGCFHLAAMRSRSNAYMSPGRLSRRPLSSCMCAPNAAGHVAQTDRHRLRKTNGVWTS